VVSEEGVVVFEVCLVPGEDDPAPERSGGVFARELEDAGADSVSARSTAGPPVAGAKGAAAELGGLLVEVVTAGVPGLVTTLLAWLTKRPDDRLKIKYRDGDRECEIECAKGDVAQAEALIQALQRSVQAVSVAHAT